MDVQKKLRLALVGLGGRGRGLLGLILPMHDIVISSLCDRYADRVEQAAADVEAAGRPRPFVTTSDREAIARDDVDCVITASDWWEHIPVCRIAIAAGKPCATEVGGASSVEECWDLVRATEATGVPCMMLENCCYDRDELAILNLVRQGLFGELLHMEGAYGHDLRESITTGLEHRHYRFHPYASRNGENYPTHALGPLAKMLRINRGNRFVSLSSFAGKSRGLSLYAQRNLPADHPANKTDFRQADIVTTVLTTALGETVVLTLDTSSPRPYSRGLRVQGTNGIWQFDNQAIHLEGRSATHQWEPWEAVRGEYEHPLWQAADVANYVGGHGGMDWLILRAFFENVESRRLPIDVYDTATWMAVTPLSEQSVAMGGHPVPFPDFTNGRWMVREAEATGPYNLD